MMNRIEEYLGGNSYPGRGIIIGKTPDGDHGVIAYFIMGRSGNSRNRIFVIEEKGIRTEAYDPAKLEDPSLIIYHPVRVFHEHTIVTNGDQTDTIYEYLKDGNTFEDALRIRVYEPDAPNYTPRISGIVTAVGGDFSYKLSLIKSGEGEDVTCLRFFYEYEKPIPGQGHLIHTYMKDGNPLPSFEGEPKLVEIVGDMEEFGDRLWNSLDEENKVSLFVRYINLSLGTVATKIYNKHEVGK
ncbi:MAG: IMP cyclohydrolase [Anaerovoracaceae bacterium]|jgi:IMP cyclohydrolase